MTDQAQEVVQETEESAVDSGSLLENVHPSEVSAPVDNPDEHPEWFKHQKYKTVEDQAKAYAELEKKFGGFTGAPEEYEFSVPEELDFELAEDDPLLGDFKEIAKKHGMSQEAFEEFGRFYVEQLVADRALVVEQAKTRREEQLKMLGPKAEERLNHVASWAKAQLGSEDMYNKFAAGMTDAGMVEVFEQIMKATGNAPQATAHQQPSAPAMTMEQVQEMQFAVDEFGNRKMQDPEYRKKVEEAYARVVGSGHTATVL